MDNISPLVAPQLAMILLTVFVWFYMFSQRLPAILRLKIRPDEMKDPNFLSRLPGSVNYPSDNLKNLFELPILFYVLSLISINLQVDDPVVVVLAWLFAGLRMIHSLIHCTYNNVHHRFYAYGLSSFVLFGMVGRVIVLVF